MSRTTRGVAASLLASALFGGMFYLSGVVSVPAEVVFGWRVLLTVALYALALTHAAARRMFAEYVRLLRARWWRSLLLMALTALVSVQLWLFAWAPQNGYALDATLGFLLLPIALILGGRFVLRQTMTRGQWSAVGVAVAAVTVQMLLTPAMSWVTLVICLGYPVYFILRRLSGLDSPAGFGVEMAVATPVAVLLLTSTPGPESAPEGAAVALIGIASACAMFAHLAASRMLTLPVFGLVGYVEPVLLVAAALLLAEIPTETDVVVYGLLAAALILLAADGARAASSSGKQDRSEGATEAVAAGFGGEGRGGAGDALQRDAVEEGERG